MAKAKTQYRLACAFCNQLFTAFRSTALTCSEKCRKLRQRHPENAVQPAVPVTRAPRKAPVSIARRCKFCQIKFEAKRSDAFLCSPLCRKSWNRSPELASEPVAPRTSTIVALERTLFRNVRETTPRLALIDAYIDEGFDAEVANGFVLNAIDEHISQFQSFTDALDFMLGLGFSHQQIAARLNAEGHKTVEGGTWKTGTVTWFLQDYMPSNRHR